MRAWPPSSLLALSFLVAIGCSSSPIDRPPVQDGSVDVPTPVDQQTSTDATTDVDETPITCRIAEESNLPGVRIHVTTDDCTFTVAQAQAGIHIPYEITVEQDVDTIPTEPPGSYCYPPGASGLMVGAVLSGGDQRYCRCDEGPPDGFLCTKTSRVRAGVYPATFDWDGVNWFGPSDTGNRKGAAFPPGLYRLDITARGSIGSAPPPSAPDAGGFGAAPPEGLPAFTISAAYAVKIVP